MDYNSVIDKLKILIVEKLSTLLIDGRPTDELKYNDIVELLQRLFSDENIIMQYGRDPSDLESKVIIDESLEKLYEEYFIISKTFPIYPSDVFCYLNDKNNSEKNAKLVIENIVNSDDNTCFISMEEMKKNFNFSILEANQVWAYCKHNNLLSEWCDQNYYNGYLSSELWLDNKVVLMKT